MHPGSIVAANSGARLYSSERGYFRNDVVGYAVKNGIGIVVGVQKSIPFLITWVFFNGRYACINSSEWNIVG